MKAPSRSHGRQRALACVGALSLALVLAGSASGADWSGPRELAAKVFISPALIVTARDGSSVTVWSQDDEEGLERVFLRRITAKGVMRPPVVVSGVDDPVFYDVAVDDDGDAVVVWQIDAPDPVQEQVVARRVSRSGEMGPIVQVSDGTVTSSLPKVSLTPSGVATIVHNRGLMTDELSTVVRRMRRDSSLGEPTHLPWAYIGARPVSSRSGHVAFALAPTMDGRAHVARVDPDGDVHVRELAGDLAGDDGVAAVDLDRRGNAYAVVTTADRSRGWVREWRVGGRLGPARRFAPTGQEVDWVGIRSDLAGDTVVAWADGRDTSSSYTLRARPWRDGRLGRVTDLGRVDGFEPPSGGEVPVWNIDLDDDGDGVLAWEVWTEDVGDTIVRTQVVRKDGSFAKRRDLGIGGAPNVAMSPTGEARLMLWSDVQDDTQLLLWTRG